MRKKRNPQCSMELHYVPHEICSQLSGISQWLDTHPQFNDWIYEDLSSGDKQNTGRNGLSAESVLRAALLKKYLDCDYDYLSFVLMDSMLFRDFCRLEPNQRPSRSSLHGLISLLTASTWERINNCQLMTAKDQGIEKGRTVAIDSTVTESDIKPPCDSDLLASSVKEICRLLKRGQTLTATPLYEYTHHNRAVKDAARKCIYARKEERDQHYKKLLQLTRKSRKVLIEATFKIANARQQGQCLLADDAEKWQADVDHLLPLVDAIVSQTERRVLKGEKVPAQEKVVRNCPEIKPTFHFSSGTAV